MSPPLPVVPKSSTPAISFPNLKNDNPYSTGIYHAYRDGSVFLIRSYGAPNGAGRCSLA